MDRDELLFVAQEFRDGILDGQSSDMMCFAVSAPLEGYLNFCGVSATMVKSDTGECEHYWILLEDGLVLDPTADQLNPLTLEEFPPVYLGKPTRFHEVVEIERGEHD